VEDAEKVVCLSGRYDPPHPGHITTLQRLGRRFKRVLVIVLNYPERKYPVDYVIQILEEILGNSVGTYEVFSNQDHFAKITKEQADLFKFDVYAAGNLETLDHMQKLGYDILWTDRTWHYEATDSRMAEDFKEVMRKYLTK
jgi:cytidyltransferase-like protein